MTMHVVLGDGEMTRRELTETLADLWRADEEAQQPFWFLIQGKSEPTDTDKALVNWLEKNDVYYEVVTDDQESMADIYAQPQDTHTAKKMSQKVVGLMQSKPDEGETAEILALFFDTNDPSAAEDRWLNGVIQAAYDGGFPTRALNDGLIEIDLSEDASEPEPTPEPTPEPAKPAKKVAAKKAAPEKAAPKIPTREQLEEMEPSEVKEVAAGLGIVLPPRTRATTYIEHILGEGKATTEVEEPVEELALPEPTEVTVSTNGYVDPDEIAGKVADILWERIRKAFA